ncbi:MAG: dihydroneopterin aldolase [Sphingobacteriales bacterium]|nr:dihydroneopterin aldolase [Sphingobacteriales bacterium]
MPDVMTIELRGLSFHAFHGLYEEEKKTGNEFRVELRADYSPPGAILTSLEDTVNYVALYEILQEAMKEPRALLETLVMEIAETIHDRFPQVTKVEVSVYKLHPPIAAFTGSVGVTYKKEY